MKSLSALTVALVLGACAATPPKPANGPPLAATAKPKLVCTREVPTGTILPVTVCRTPEEIEQRRQHDMDSMDKAKAIQSAQGGVQAAH